MSKPELFYRRQLGEARDGSGGFGMCRRVRGAHRIPPHFSLALLCALGLALLLSLVLPTSVSAASAGTGRISGQLLNGSASNAPVANQSVTLQMAQGNSSRDLITLTTDAQGRYAFSALQSDSSVQYAIYTLYQGAQYVTDLIDLSKHADQQVNLTVYAATTSITNIAVVQATILVDKPNAQTGMLAVSEDFFFENLSNTTYVGSLDASKGKPDALLFSLPSNARFLSLGSGFAGYRSIQVNTGFASNVALLPGTSRLSFSFQVPYSGSAYHFAYSTVYPTVTLSLLTPLNVLTTPQGLTPQGQVNAKSGVYQMFKAQTLRANRTVQANLEGLPVPVPATPTKAQAPINPAMLWLVAALILLLALAGLGGYLYNMRRQQAVRAKQRSTGKRNGTMPAKNKKSAVPATKKALLQELLELDQSHEAGKIKQTAYDERRARLLARLRPLMDGAMERRAEVSSQTARSSSEGEE